jgi:glycerol-3-phosphate acyltransferase PlsY
MVGITNLSLTMAAFTGSLSIEEIKTSFETVKNIDVKIWSDKNIGTTNLQRRKQVLKKVG